MASIGKNLTYQGGAAGVFDPFNIFHGHGSKSKKPQAPEFQPYTGYRPPRVSYLRPVEDDITKILRERAAGQGVGYDPARRQELLQDFDIEQGRDLEDQKADIQNRISGMGLSRNPAVYDELMGRATREAGREKNLYRNRVDIEDLGRRNEERDVNTQRLADLNRFNFGQENAAANFDLSVYNAEQPNRYKAFDAESSQYQDPIGTALDLAGKAAGLYADYQTGGMYSTAKNVLGSSQTPSAGAYQSPNSSTGNSPTDARRNYLNQLALQSGYNFQF
jgi:hypothetical protein